MLKRFLIMLLICLPCVGCDQITKYQATLNLKPSRETLSYFGGLLRMQYAENPGAWGGMGDILPDPIRQLIFTWGVALFLAVLAGYILRQAHSTLVSVALSLVLAGGIGNLIDRALHGYVVDFLYLGYDPIGWLHTNIFNVADMAIMAGAGLLIFHTFQQPKADPPAEPAEA